MKKLYFFPLFAFLISIFSFFSSCKNGNKDNHFIFDEGLVWNTEFHISFRGRPALKDSIRKVLEEVGHNLSVFDSTSLVSRANRSDTISVNNDFIRVYDMSKKINRVSDGLFDPTLSPLITAWGFGPGHKASSDTARIDSLLNIVGIEKTYIDSGKLIKKVSGIQFNFSALAKGYGCDRIAEMFKNNGVNDFMIEIGGEIVASGEGPRGGNWNISIDRPLFSNAEIKHDSQVVVAFSNMGLATSGNYRNYHQKGSDRYGHTISPLTGRPAVTDVLSATVMAPTAMEADALATAFMAMGSKNSISTALKLNLPVLLVCSDTIWSSPQFDRLIVK